MSRFWVTIEGLEGVGKTYLSRLLARRIGPDCLLLGELTDLDADDLPGQVVTALSSEGDVFLRTGHPLTETFALLALKIRESERLQVADLHARIVLEDRGVDSVALYQAAILAADRPIAEMYAVARRIYAAASGWRPAPDMTVLLVDDFEACVRRFADRVGRPVPYDERALMSRADGLYALQAESEPHRFVIVDRRGQSETQTLETLVQACIDRMSLGEQPCET